GLPADASPVSASWRAAPKPPSDACQSTRALRQTLIPSAGWRTGLRGAPFYSDAYRNLRSRAQKRVDTATVSRGVPMASYWLERHFSRLRRAFRRIMYSTISTAITTSEINVVVLIFDCSSSQTYQPPASEERVIIPTPH